ncbi:hypothetical protein ANAPC5_01259 [Anaplasma phagocytophilum]|nr:hypothetical protein ANAPC5_01259 [Anaplasma phagocytophilum]
MLLNVSHTEQSAHRLSRRKCQRDTDREPPKMFTYVLLGDPFWCQKISQYFAGTCWGGRRNIEGKLTASHMAVEVFLIFFSIT